MTQGNKWRGMEVVISIFRSGGNAYVKHVINSGSMAWYWRAMSCFAGTAISMFISFIFGLMEIARILAHSTEGAEGFDVAKIALASRLSVIFDDPHLAIIICLPICTVIAIIISTSFFRGNSFHFALIGFLFWMIPILGLQLI